jgi:hypothetical protein
MFAKTYREGKASGEERRAAHLQLVDDSLELLLRISERLIESLEEVLGTLELVQSQRFGGGGSGRGRGGDLPGVDERVPKNPPREVLLLRGGEEACGGPENESQREDGEREGRRTIQQDNEEQDERDVVRIGTKAKEAIELGRPHSVERGEEGTHSDENEDLWEFHDGGEDGRGSRDELLDAERGADHLLGIENLSLCRLRLIALAQLR